MPFVPMPNIVQVEIIGRKDGQNIENRIFVDVLAAPSSADVISLADTVGVWMTSSYKTILPSSVQLLQATATDMSVAEGFQHTTAASVAGTKEGPLPNECSMALSLRSDQRGRSARGRLYILGLPGNDRATENTMSGPWLSDAIAAGNALRTAITGLGFVWVVVSLVSNKVPRPGGPVYFPITTVLFTDNVIDSQRRRKPGVGS